MAEVDKRRAAFGATLADGDMDMVTYQAARERLAERERQLQADLASLPLPDTDPLSDGLCNRA